MHIAIRGGRALDRPVIRRAIRAALQPYGLPRDATLVVAFVDDDAMRSLNKAYRGLDRTTDVLSFGQALPRGRKGAAAVPALQREPDGSLELGDIVISAAQARRQALRGRRPLRREIALLAAHGALHLLGSEDDTREGYREMLRLGSAAAVAATRAERRT